MKASLITLSCILLGGVACAPIQTKKLASYDGGGGIDPIATGPTSRLSYEMRHPPMAGRPTLPPAKEVALSELQSGDTVGVFQNGKVTVTLESVPKDGYGWRLGQIPDPTVLKLVSQSFLPPTTAESHGQQQFVFQAVGPGAVNVKMWYGNLKPAALSSNPSFEFVAAVPEQAPPEEHAKRRARRN